MFSVPTPALPTNLFPKIASAICFATSSTTRVAFMSDKQPTVKSETANGLFFYHYGSEILHQLSIAGTLSHCLPGGLVRFSKNLRWWSVDFSSIDSRLVISYAQAVRSIFTWNGHLNFEHRISATTWLQLLMFRNLGDFIIHQAGRYLGKNQIILTAFLRFS